MFSELPNFKKHVFTKKKNPGKKTLLAPKVLKGLLFGWGLLEAKLAALGAQDGASDGQRGASWWSNWRQDSQKAALEIDGFLDTSLDRWFIWFWSTLGAKMPPSCHQNEILKRSQLRKACFQQKEKKTIVTKEKYTFLDSRGGSWKQKPIKHRCKNRSYFECLLGASLGRHIHRVWVDFERENGIKLASNWSSTSIEHRKVFP